MRLLKSLIFFVLLAVLGCLLYYVQFDEEDSNQVTFQDQLMVDSQVDTLLRENVVDTSQMSLNKSLTVLYYDYEVFMDKTTLKIQKSNQLVYQKDFPHLTIRQILMADMNGNDMPECWILGLKESKSVEIFALEVKLGHTKRINFPTLKGSQAFGYAGEDSLYLDKSTIVRQFKFVNDPNADLSAGTRACYYQFGIDQSFILKKTLDLE